jgi:hypothetical protein
MQSKGDAHHLTPEIGCVFFIMYRISGDAEGTIPVGFVRTHVSKTLTGTLETNARWPLKRC